MKESKKNHDINEEELNKNTEKRFNEELNEIKEKLNSEKLSDEFKENIQAKLQEELNKTDTNSKGKIIKFPTLTRKLAGICACFVFLCSGCFAFADDIENVIFNIFNNTDRIVEKAIAEGNYREIDMEYIEDNGVSIKVDYVAFDDDNLYIAFNVLGEEEFDRTFLDDICIKDAKGNLVYEKYKNGDNIGLKTVDKHISKNSMIIVYAIENLQKNELEKSENLFIEITKTFFINGNEKYDKCGKWNFYINI